jgi:hypothetical protein
LGQTTDSCFTLPGEIRIQSANKKQQNGSASLISAYFQHGSCSDHNYDEIHYCYEDKRGIFLRALSEEKC